VLGDAAAADAELAALASAGLPPGPAAYHAAVIAAARAGDADGALDAMRRAHSAGVHPLPGSYVALIRAFCAVGDATAARAVMTSMNRAVPDALPGWLALCKGLFAAGMDEDAAATAERGQAVEGWTPDAELYGALVSYLVTQGKRGLARAADVVAEDMPRAGVVPMTAHANIILRAEAAFTSVQEADALLAAMGRGELGPGCRPDIHSYNAVLAGFVRAAPAGDPAVVRPPNGDFWAPALTPGEPAPDAVSAPPVPLPLSPWESGLPPRTDPASGDRIQELVGEILLGGCLPDATTHALMCEAHTQAGSGTERAMLAFQRMLALGTPAPAPGTALMPLPDEPTNENDSDQEGAWEEAGADVRPPWGTPGAAGHTGPLPDAALALLLRRLVEGPARPWELLEVMVALAADRRTPPPGSLAPLTKVEAGCPPSLAAALPSGAPGAPPAGILAAPLSALAAWVPAALAAGRSARPAALGLMDVEKEAQDEEKRARDEEEEARAGLAALDATGDPVGGARYFNGVLLDEAGNAITPEGDIIPVSRATREELAAELEARDQSPSGTKIDMYKRVQAARVDARLMSRDDARLSDDFKKTAEGERKAAAREMKKAERAAKDVREAGNEVEWVADRWVDGEPVPPPGSEGWEVVVRVNGRVVGGDEDKKKPATLQQYVREDRAPSGRLLRKAYILRGLPPTGEDLAPASGDGPDGAAAGARGRDDEEDMLGLTSRAFAVRSVARQAATDGEDAGDGGGGRGGGLDSDSEGLDSLDDVSALTLSGRQEKMQEQMPGLPAPWWPARLDKRRYPGLASARLAGPGAPPPTPAFLALNLLNCADACGVGLPPADLAAYARVAAAERDPRLAAQVAARLQVAAEAAADRGGPSPAAPAHAAVALARDLLAAVTLKPGDDWRADAGPAPGAEGGEEGEVEDEAAVAARAAVDAEDAASAREVVLACLGALGLGDRVPALDADLAVSDAAYAAAAVAAAALGAKRKEEEEEVERRMKAAAAARAAREEGRLERRAKSRL